MVLGAVFERFRQSAILGYLLAGFILGPGALKLVANDADLSLMAEVGIALLLFTIGLEFSLKRLLTMGRTAVLGGTLQIVGTMAVFAVLGLIGGLGLRQGIALGLVAAASSTASVLRLLRDRAEMDAIHGRHAVGILLLQDLALVPMVVIMTSMGSETQLTRVAAQIAVAFGFFCLLAVVFYFTSRYLVPRALSAATLLQNREILILLATVMALGSMYVAHLLHISPALGAFIAGMLLAESPFATQIRSDIGTPRVLLVTLFFASAGMAADLQWILHHLPLVVGGVIAVVALKAVVVWGIFRFLKVASAQALATGICLAQVGEFSFVLAEIGVRVGSIDQDLRQLMVSVTFGTLLLTPWLVTRALGMAHKITRTPYVAEVSVSETGAIEKRLPARDHVLIIGFGPAGRSVVRSMQEIGVPCVILELNHETVQQARQEGLLAEIGDATHEDVLEHVHARNAQAVVITIPDFNASLQMLRSVRAMSDEVPVIVRSRYHRYMEDFSEAGATFVVDEETQVGEFLGRRLAKGLSRVRAAEA